MKVLPTEKDPFLHSPDSKPIESEKPIDHSSVSSVSCTEINESSSSNCCSQFFTTIGNFFISIWKCIQGIFISSKKPFTSNLVPTEKFKEICDDIPKFFQTIYPGLELPDEPPNSDLNYVCKEKNETLFHLLCTYATEKVYANSSSPFVRYYGLHITHLHVQYALDMGADINKTNGKKETVLHMAKTKETTELLISKNPNLVHARDQLNQIPLHHENWNVETAVLLVNNGSDVHAEDKFGNKPVSYASNPNLREYLHEEMRKINTPLA